jgi:hypothetical protein
VIRRPHNAPGGTGSTADAAALAYSIFHKPNGLVRVGPVGLEPTTYGETGVHRSRVIPVVKRALPVSERAACGQLGRLHDSIVAA